MPICKVNPQVMAMVMNGQVVPTRQLVEYRLTLRKRKRHSLTFGCAWFLAGTDIIVNESEQEVTIGDEGSTITLQPPIGDFPRPFVLTDVMRIAP